MVRLAIESFLEHLEYDYTILGVGDIPVDNVAPIDKGTTSDLVFLFFG